jgi:hypothetical protein
LTSIYKEFEETVRRKGEKVNIELFGPLGAKSAWIVGDLLITLEEGTPLRENRRVVSVIDRGENRQKLFLYLSPDAVQSGAEYIFGIADPKICSEKRLEEILKRINET